MQIVLKYCENNTKILWETNHCKLNSKYLKLEKLTTLNRTRDKVENMI